MGKIKIINDSTPASLLLEIKIGDIVNYSNKIGKVKNITFNESNNFWEIAFHLEKGETLYLKKDKTTC